MEQKTTQLWNNFSDSLHRFILKKVKSEAVADDLLQETFIRIHSKIDSLKDETKVQSWIFQIARNIVTDYFRKSVPFADEQIPEHLESGEEADEEMTDAIQSMVKFMDDLSKPDCQALCQVEFEGKSIKEYAESAGISYTAAKTRVARARHKLGDLLMNCCHFEFDKYGTVLSHHPIRCCCCSHNRE